MKTRRKYDEQFKRDALALIEKTGKSISEIAADLGIRYDLLSRWVRESKDTSKKAFTGNGNARDEEIARMKKEITDLKLERDILKKAVAIFSVPGKGNMNS